MGVKNPERFMQNVQKLEQNLQQRVQKRVQRQEMRRIVEEAQKNPEVLKSLRKLFEEMPGKKSSEIDRRKLDVVGPVPCLNWGFPNTVKGTGTSFGDGTAVVVNYDMNAINTCADTISNVQFNVGQSITCPEGCTANSYRVQFYIGGLPSSIDQGKMSLGTATEVLSCREPDGTPTAPNSVTATVLLQGVRNGNAIIGPSETFDAYP